VTAGLCWRLSAFENLPSLPMLSSLSSTTEEFSMSQACGFCRKEFKQLQNRRLSPRPLPASPFMSAWDILCACEPVNHEYHHGDQNTIQRGEDASAWTTCCQSPHVSRQCRSTFSIGELTGASFFARVLAVVVVIVACSHHNPHLTA
jgi:hypothetical protein